MPTAATVTKVPCPRGCGAQFISQKLRGTVIFHECPHTLEQRPYADHSTRDIAIILAGPNAGEETLIAPP